VTDATLYHADGSVCEHGLDPSPGPLPGRDLLIDRGDGPVLERVSGGEGFPCIDGQLVTRIEL